MKNDNDRNPILSVAALFKGDFSIDWIQALTRSKASQVLFCFETAVKQGFIRHGDIGFFCFSDAKAQREWRAKLGAKEKEHYSRRIAAMLIKELPDTSEKPETIAAHLLHISRNTLDGCRWLMRGAAGLRARYQIEEALGCYLKVLDDLSGRSQQGADPLFCDAAIEFSKLNTARHDVKHVLALLGQAMLRAKGMQDLNCQAMIHMHFAKNKWLQSKYKSALSHFENSWQLAQGIGEEKLLRAISHFKTFLLYWQGLFKDVVEDYEKSHGDVERFPYGRFPLLAAMTVGTCYGQIGQVTQAIGMIDAIRGYCLEKGDRGLAAHSGICIGATLLDIGHIDEALGHLVPAVQDARRLQPDWTTIQGELMLAYAYYLKEQNDQALSHLTQFYKLGRQVDVSVRPWPYLMELCWAMDAGRLPALAGLSIRQEVQAMIKGGNIFLKGVAYRFKALLEKKNGAAHPKIIESLNKSIQHLALSGHAIELAKSRFELARIYLLQSDQRQAEITAAPAGSVLQALNANLIPDDLKPLIHPSSLNAGHFAQLVDINHELCKKKDSKEILQYIISIANRMTGAERGGIFLIDASGQTSRLHLRASKNLTQDQIDLPAFGASLGMMSAVIQARRGKVQALSRPEKSAAPDAPIILSSIGVPIIGKDRVLGVLYLDNRLLSHAFHESLLSMLSPLASYLALVLENEALRMENDGLSSRIEALESHYELQSMESRPGDFDGIIGETPEIKKVLAQISEIAPTDTAVLILGETGVGKELVAKAILNNSLRKHQPFISLNCTALSAELIYSELFGHEKGSFTGAATQHIGRFEKAHNGTLFLDEIGDLPLGVQVRLLRVLETKEFERVGGKQTLYSDFRLITATNRDLQDAIQAKRFRQDLFYRIDVFPIYVPPLRERKPDIPLLVDFFLQSQARRMGKRSRLVSDEQMDELMRYDWPGNVRELKNYVARFIASPHARITDRWSGPLQPSSAQDPAAVSLRENERRHIERALAHTYGKIHGPGGAAELLDIHPNTLTFRMKKLGIAKAGRGRRKV
jgi:transcriptional regulator with GAF, ATPase, and Fis domain